MNLLPWCVAVPLLFAALLLACASLVGRSVTTAIAVATSISSVVLCTFVLRDALALGTLTYWFGGWHPGNRVGLGIAFEVEPLGAGLALGIAIVTTAILLYAHPLFDEVGVTFDVLVLVHLGAAIAFVYTSDLFDLTVFYELTNVCEFAVAGYLVATRLAVRGAFNFAIATGLGAFALIFALTLLEGRTGGLNAAAIGESLTRAPSPALALCAFGLIASGLLVKSAVPPFHFWFIDAQTAAPTPVGVMFSGIVSILGIYGLERTWTATFASALAPEAPHLHSLLVILGLGGACAAALLAFTAADLKRALGFAAAAHTSLLVATGIMADARSLAATAYLILGFAFSIAALGMWIGILQKHLDTVLDEEYGGRAREHWPSIAVFAIAIVGIAGVPPGPAALGRALLSEPFALFSVAVSSLVTARFAIAGWRAYVGVHDRSAPRARMDGARDWYTVLPAIVLGAAALAAGAIPWTPLAIAAIAFVNPHAMAAALLHRSLAPAAVPSAAPTAAQVFALGAATCAASAVAAAVRPATRRLALVRRIHALHNGSVGDYVTWLLGGTAAITALAGVFR